MRSDLLRQWRWLPVIFWMAVIFSASSDAMSSGHTSRIIGPIVRWLVPTISDAALGRVVFAIRKTAHVTEYAVLALLFWWAWRKSVTDRRSVEARGPEAQTQGAQSRATRVWRWSDALLALGISAIYAASDELHQYFVPTREARFGDVMLDTAGAALGLLLIWIIGRWRDCW